MPPSCPDAAIFVDLLEGKLPLDEEKALHQHIESCPSCSSLLIELAEVFHHKDPHPPTTIGRYEIHGLRGRGAMGAVFEATDPLLERKVALKTITIDDPLIQATLLREARLLARITHPNVLPVYDVGQDQDDPYIVMHLIQGSTLQAWIETQNPTEPQIIALYLQAAEGLEAVHNAGIVHRDIKPDNIMVEPDGHVRLVDFGVGHTGDAFARTLAGTPFFMSPEQHRGEPTTHQTDLYALSVSLFYSLYKIHPFGGKNLEELRHNVLHHNHTQTPAGFDNPSLLHELQKGYALSPQDRHPNARAWIDAFAPLARETLLPKTSPQPAQLIGRRREKEALQKLLRTKRNITITGTAGVGKTRLAQEVAAHTHAETCFVDLRDIATPEAFLRATSRALKLSANANPAQAILSSLQRETPLLLLLDNAEETCDFLAEHLQIWLSRAPLLRILTTSRRPHNSPHEARFPLSPMPLGPRADATTFFLQKAREANPHFALTPKNQDEIFQIIEALDGLPLALELAAARMLSLSPSDFLKRLHQRFSLLQSRRQNRQHRTPSLKVALNTSWSMLHPWEKGTLAQLSVFRNGFDLDAAEDVLDLSTWPEAPLCMDVLEDLLDHSLLQRDSQQSRYDLLQSVREYAASHLSQEDAAAAEHRHAAHFARYGHPQYLESFYYTGGVQRGDLLLHNNLNLQKGLLHALAHQNAHQIENYAAALTWMGIQYGPRPYFTQLVRKAHESPLPPKSALRVQERFIQLLCPNHTEEAATLARDLIQRSTQHQDAEHHGRARTHLSVILLNQGEPEQARQEIKTAIQIAENHNLQRLALLWKGELARILRAQGNLEESTRLFEESLDGARAQGDAFHAPVWATNLGMNEVRLGLLDSARVRYETSLEEARTTQDRELEATLYNLLAVLYKKQGNPEAALHAYRRALHLHTVHGNTEGLYVAQSNQANIHLEQGHYDQARALYFKALEGARIAGHKALLCIVQNNLGDLELAQGNLKAARNNYTRAMDQARKISLLGPLPYMIAGCARVELARDNPKEAQKHLLEALDEAYQHTPTPDPYLEGTLFNLMGSTALALNEPEKARASLLRAHELLSSLKASPLLGENHCYQAQLSLLENNPHEASLHAQKARALAIESRANTKSNLGRLLSTLVAQDSELI